MPNSTITTNKIKNKTSGFSADVGEIIVNDGGALRTIDGNTDITIENANKLDGKTYEEVRAGIDAKTLESYGISDLLSKDRYKVIRKLVDTNNNGGPERFFIAVTSNDDILFRGRNFGGYFVNGQVEDTFDTFTIHNPKYGISKIKEVYASGFAVFVLYEDGDLYAMGQNDLGQLGLGNTAHQYSLVLTATNVEKVSTTNGGYHTNAQSIFILKNDGTVWGTGENSAGELGLGTVNDYVTIWTQATIPAGVGTPIEVIINNNLNGTSFILTDTGKVLASGYNAYGALGDGTTTNRSSFLQIMNLDAHFVTKLVSHGGTRNSTTAHYRGTVICLTDTGLVFGWGANTQGQLGIGVTTVQSLPVELNSYVGLPYDDISNPIVDIYSSAGEWGQFALRTVNGDLFMAGHNAYGQIGDGTVVTGTSWYHTMSNVKYVQICSSREYTLYTYVFAITNDNDLYSWGYNVGGQCGQNNITNILVPTLVDFEYSDKIVQISCIGQSTSSTTMILLDDGRVFGCGDNDYQQISNNTSGYVARLVKII